MVRQALPKSDNLVLYAPLDGADFKDYSDNNITGTVNSAPLRPVSGGPVGAAWDFDGTDDFITLDAPFFDAADISLISYTVGAWVNYDVVNVNQTIYSEGRAASTDPFISVGLEGSSGKFTGLLRADDATTFNPLSTTVASAGTWYHVIAVFNGSNVQMYVNGAADGSSVSVTSTDFSPLDRSAIGILRRDTNDHITNGKYAQVTIYDTALTTDEVKALYAATQRRMAVMT